MPYLLRWSFIFPASSAYCEKNQLTIFWNRFPFFLENNLWHFMQVVSWGDNLHEKTSGMQEIAELSFLKKGIISLSFAELAQRVVKVNNIVDLNQYWHFMTLYRKQNMYLYNRKKKSPLVMRKENGVVTKIK